MTPSLNILILEDEPIIEIDLREFCSELGHKIVASCYTLLDAQAALQTERPNFALVDIRLGSKNDGLKFGHILTEEFGIPFLYITSFSDNKMIEEAKKTFPSGYLVKPITKGGLNAAIQVGYSIFSEWHRNARNILEKIQARAIEPLTQREMEIVSELCTGKTNVEIAETQFVSVNTVKTHLKNIYSKLNVESRSQLLALI